MLCALIILLVNVAIAATFVTGLVTIIKKIF
jgi:hypothetical protein